MRITVHGIYFITCCIYLTIFAILKSRMKAPQKKSYPASIIVALTLAIFALFVASKERIPIFGSRQIDLETILFGSALLASNFCISPLVRKYTPATLRERNASFLPHTTKERLWWVLVSLVIGVGEEIVYRAVLFGLFLKMIGDYWIAGLMSAVLFALAHARFGLIGTLNIFFVGIALQWLVKVSGGLYASMAVHFVYNLSAGIVYGASRKAEPQGEQIGNVETKAAEMAVVAQQQDEP